MNLFPHVPNEAVQDGPEMKISPGSNILWFCSEAFLSHIRGGN